MSRTSKQRRDLNKKRVAKEARRQIERQRTGTGTSSRGQLNMDFIDKLNEKRTQYAAQWNAVNASLFSDEGHYEWMKGLIGPYDTILEIGTGAGSGTLALVGPGKTIISFDENPACLRFAKDRLEANGNAVQYIQREATSATQDGYIIRYSPISLDPLAQGVTLLEGDLLTDNDLVTWLKSLPPFDAIVCWLIGTHGARQENRGFDWKKLGNHPGMYRLTVQNRVYELADELLRPGGVLQIVDRGEAPESALLRTDCLNAHRDQASVTSLQVESLEYRLYEDPHQSGGLEIGLSLGKSGRMPNEFKMALVSVISRKP